MFQMTTVAAPEPETHVYTARDIAEFFISKIGRSFDPAKVMLLVYMAHGFSLGWLNRPLISERILVGPQGPIIVSLDIGYLKAFSSIPTPKFDDETAWLLNQVWAIYGKLDTVELRALIQKPDTPWREAKALSQRYLENEDIQRHYAEILEKAQKNIEQEAVSAG
jgi:uncharacterized phage-associated protein